MSETITYARPDGVQVSGYLSAPSGSASAPGMVVIQEWWGLNDQIKAVADRLAAAGYRAVVPDLYRGKVAIEEREAKHLMGDLNFADAASQDIRGAVQFLKRSGSGKTGVTGFCMGGALTVLSACHVPEADAAVIWYGCPPLEYVDASRVRAPLMGHWGTQDSVFPISQVEGLEAKLREAGIAFEFYRYEAKHAFANEGADAKHLAYLGYNPAAARLAWERTLAFLQRTLRPEH
jgi:carboxymethylenebutenolidase